MSRLGVVPKPGIELGLYPERDLEHRSAFEKTVLAGMAPAVRRLRRGRTELNNAVRRVRALESNYSSQSDSELRQAAKRLGVEMRRKGLKDELLLQSFALVRESAERSLGMRPYDVQIKGGWAMIRGMIAEMQTGEGKTLTATLPACAAALAGVPVHVITVNDYLVARDAETMRPLYEFLGLSVGAILEDMQGDERRIQYACDITYCTNKQVAFDYLKDRVLLGKKYSRMQLDLESLYAENPRSERLLLRGLCFAVVDEADSVMIDEAQTPLILSAPDDQQEATEVYSEALAIAREFEEDEEFTIDRFHRVVEITPDGLDRIDDDTAGMKGPWVSSKFRKELITKALTALYCFNRDEHYLVSDDKVMIVDEFTGRVMADRTWEHGLHQLIEVKEGCEASARRKTIARVSYQRFFRRYLRLSGMTGTASSASSELWSIYGLKVAKIPTNKPSLRQVKKDRIFIEENDKWRAAVNRISQLYKKGQPVLVGTRSVANSDKLSSALTSAGIEHVVLNARQDDEEADIIANAGTLATVTVATNMAGRGTDIKLQEGVVELGGLHVLAAEKNESPRIDRQLIGRSGRQGDPGSAETIVALGDDVFQRYCPPFLLSLAKKLTRPGERTVGTWMTRLLVWSTQRAAERRGVAIRKQMLDMDEYLDNTLAFSGQSE